MPNRAQRCTRDAFVRHRGESTMKHSSTIVFSILSLGMGLVIATACRSNHAASSDRTAVQKSGEEGEEDEADEGQAKMDASAQREEQEEEDAKEETITLAQTP